MKVVLLGLAALALTTGSVAWAVLAAPRDASDPTLHATPLAASAVSRAAAVHFDDPAGDASDVGWGDAGTTAACLVGAVLDGRCMEPLPVQATARSAPHLDIIGVDFEEGASSDVVLTMSVSRIDEGFAGVETNEAFHRMTFYSVCWGQAADDPCSRQAYLTVMRHDGATHLEANFEAYLEECNEWWWCSWSIPVEVHYGAPAQIVFRIPKAWAAFDGEALHVAQLSASTGWADQPNAFPMWHPGVTIHTPARHVHDHFGVVAGFGVGDMTPELWTDIDLAPATSQPELASDAPVLTAAPGNMHGGGSIADKKELDLLGYDLHEDAEGALVVVFALAEAAAKPAYDFDYALALGLEGGNVLEIGYRQAQGEAEGYAGHCIMEECQESETFLVPALFTPGAPASITLTIPRDVLVALGDPQPGERTTVSWLSSMYTEGSQYWGDYESDLYGDVHHAFMVDSIIGGMSFVFGSGHHAPMGAFGGEHGTHEH